MTTPHPAQAIPRLAGVRAAVSFMELGTERSQEKPHLLTDEATAAAASGRQRGGGHRNRLASARTGRGVDQKPMRQRNRRPAHLPERGYRTARHRWRTAATYY